MILSLYVGLSDRDGRPLGDQASRALVRCIDRNLSDHRAAVLASGTLTGEDEDGTPERSAHRLILVDDTSSVLSLVRAIARTVGLSDQRSFGLVGLSLSSTLVPTDPGDVDLWYRQAVR